MKWLLKYLKGTSHVCLEFGQDANGVIGYCDSDYGRHLDDRKSTSGYVFTLGGTVVNWQSSLQDVVALSNTKMGFMAITEAFKEAKWLKGLIEEISSCSKEVSVFCDSQSAIHLAKNQNTFHRKTNHIDVKYNFIRNVIDEKELTFMKIRTEENPSNMLTKPLPTTKFTLCVNLMGLSSCLL